MELEVLQKIAEENKNIPSEQRDYLSVYLLLEHQLVDVQRKYSKEELRYLIKSRYNIQWFEPKLKILFLSENPDLLVLRLVFINSIVNELLNHIKIDALKKTMTSFTKGTFLENSNITEYGMDISVVPDLKDVDPDDVPKIVSSLYSYVKDGYGKEKADAYFTESFKTMKKFQSIPQFLDFVRGIPNGIVDQEKRKVLAPRAAAEAAAGAVRSISGGEGLQFEKEIHKINSLPLEDQEDKFIDLYKKIEEFIEREEPKGLTVEKIRHAVQGQINAEELSGKFRLIFLEKNRKLIFLTSQLALKVLEQLPEADRSSYYTEDFGEHIPLFYHVGFNENGLDADKILNNLGEPGNGHKRLSSSLKMFLNFLENELSRKELGKIFEQRLLELEREYGKSTYLLLDALPLDLVSNIKSKILVKEFEDFSNFLAVLIKNNGVNFTPEFGDGLKGSLIENGFDFTLKENMQEQELVDAFTPLMQSMYDQVYSVLGITKTRSIFEQVYEKYSRIYGEENPVSLSVLKAVPKGILEIQKMSLLTKEQLEHLSREIKVVDVLKDEFMNIASHELKTPLIPIIGYLDAILKDKKLKLKPNIRKKLEICLKAAYREKSLVNDVLDIAKLEAGTMKFEMENLNLSELYQEILSGFDPLAKQNKIKFTYSVQKGLKVHGDEKRLGQVVSNLANNAIKFTQKGSVKVDVRKDGGTIKVSIRDTGAGIKKGFIPRLFQKFSQVDTSAKRRQEGTGLGLAISKEIVKSHGGEIWAESSGLRKGSTFYFTLPALGSEKAGKAKIKKTTKKKIIKKNKRKAKKKPIKSNINKKQI